MADSGTRPKGPPRFDFTLIDDEEFELLCFLVILMDFPEAERLRPPEDGADAGLEDSTPGRYRRCWQFKQYGGGRVSWKKCESSLDRAVVIYKMPRYTFVFAQDLTGRQKQTFRERLQERHPGVKVDHVGSSRIIAKLLSGEQGARIANYFYEDPSSNSTALMAALRAGGPLENGADVAERLAATGDFLAGYDPFFEYPATIHETGGTPPLPWPNSVLTVERVGPRSTSRTDVIPRNPEAMSRFAPSFRLLFADSEEGRRAKKEFDDALRYGGELETGEGLKVEFTQTTHLFRDHVGPLPDQSRLVVRRPAIPVRLEVEAPAGTVGLDVALEAIPPPPEWDGAFSATVAGFELLVRFRLQGVGAEQSLSWRYLAEPIPVRERLEGVKLAVALYRGGVLKMTRRDNGQLLLAEPFERREFPGWLDGLTNVLEAVMAIEEWAGVRFTLPETMLPEELHNMAELSYIIQRQQSRMKFEAIDLRVSDEQLKALDEDSVKLGLSIDTEAELFGVKFPVGRLEGVVNARIASKSRLLSGEVDVRLEPASEDDQTPVFVLVR
jgi:hypothetical protein